MPHNVAFHQGLHYLLRLKGSSEKDFFVFENFNLWPLNIYNGSSQVYCMKPEGRIHKGLFTIQGVQNPAPLFLNILWKWNNLVSVRPNYFIFIEYLRKMRENQQNKPLTPLYIWTHFSEILDPPPPSPPPPAIPDYLKKEITLACRWISEEISSHNDTSWLGNHGNLSHPLVSDSWNILVSSCWKNTFLIIRRNVLTQWH